MPPSPWTFEAGAAIARDRATGRCEVRAPGCQGRDIQTHHRQARGMGGVSGAGRAVNRPSCLLRVCLACHNTIESRRTWAEESGLLVRRPTDPAEVPALLHTVNGLGRYLLTDDGCYDWQDEEPVDWAAQELARLMAS